MKTETPREIAERIATDELLLSRDRRFLIDTIEAALNAERERAAKIAETRAERYRTKSHTQKRRGDDSLSEHFLSECNAALEIAAAIRGKD